MNCWQLLTDMENFDDVSNEMIKKYKETILKVENTTTKKVVYGYLLNANADFFTIRSSKEILEIEFNHPQDLVISIPSVQVGCYSDYSYTRSLVIFNTLPHRQWKKGLCSGNSIVINAVNNLQHTATNLFRESIMGILENPVTQTLDQAIQDLYQNKMYGVACNRSFGITLNYNNKDENLLILFFKQYPIGIVNKKEKHIEVKNKIFLQEILDTRKDWCPNYEVSV